MPAKDEDQFFEALAAETGEGERAPSRLKARLYTALIREQQKQGPLASVTETRQHGRDLCVFEDLVQIAPVGQKAKSLFFCQVCHARLLAESFENPPIWWPHCPYAEFKSR
ncbi:MAG: hypothetical protein IPM24_01300 [Bryobacterales bacterium]|jgi:hypothetical protein|nr:hypothetical protein [Bryobacterales bacterium]